MIYRHLTQFQTRKYNDLLPLLLQNYNSSKHSATACSPLELQQAYLDDDREVLARAGDRLKKRAIKMLTPIVKYPLVNIGDNVRISVKTMSDVRKQTFRKNFLANWSKDVFTVESISKGSAWQNAQYKLKNAHDHVIQQRFYRKDLQKIDVSTLTVNKKKRPDFSQGLIYNQEEQIPMMNDARLNVNRVQQQPPPTQAEEREQGHESLNRGRGSSINY